MRNISKAISRFIKRSHIAIREWSQKYKPAERVSYTKIKISEFIIDEIQIKVGSSEYIWLWVAIESKTKNILGISISKERNMFISERFLSNVIKEYGEHPVSTDGGTWYPSQACSRFLKINHHLHILLWRKVSLLKGLSSIKDRTKECFDDYFPCRKKKCKLKHVKQWFNLFANYYNKEIIS